MANVGELESPLAILTIPGMCPRLKPPLCTGFQGQQTFEIGSIMQSRSFEQIVQHMQSRD
jgi:hypothetical protein